MDPDPRTDAELVAAAAQGDASAFDALYYRYRDWVTRLAQRFTGNADDALDVLQQTFMYLLDRLPTLHLTARMTTFLYPAVKNIALTIRRKRTRWISDDQAIVSIAGPEPDTSRSELAVVMASLQESHREVVLMRFVDDMTLEEIATALHIPLGTVKSRLHNALQTLRDDPRTRAHFL